MTLSEIVQKVFAATVPPVRLNAVVFPAAVMDPPQPFTSPGFDEIARPVGKLSVNARPVNGTELLLVILNVSVVLPLRGIVDAAKVFKRTGGETTVRFALDELPVPPSVEETGPAVFM